MTELQYLRSLESTPTAAELMAGYNAAPSNYAPVPANRVIAWMGEAGRLAKLKIFSAGIESRLADPENFPSEQELGLYSAVGAVFLGAANTLTTLDMTPGGPHRQLLAALVAFGKLSDDDALGLIARGYAEGFTPATLESAAAAIAQRDAEDAAAARKAAYETQRNEWALQAYKIGDDELLRAFIAGESLPTVNDLLAFVAASRGEGV